MMTQISAKIDGAGSNKPVDDRPSFFHEVREDWEANLRDWTSPGFRALFVNRFATRVRQQSSSRVYRAVFALFYRRMYKFCCNIYGIKIAYTAHIGRRLAIHHHQGVAVHPTCHIGDDCTLRQGVTLGVLKVGPNMVGPTLGDRVDVGAGAKILGAVTIGNDAVIGANAVVARDVPAGWAAIGNPARIIRLGPPPTSS